MKHTPGPWKLTPNGPAFNLCRSYDDQAFSILLGMTHQPPGNHAANARLMSKAPEMYAVIKQYLDADLLDAADIADIDVTARSLITEIEGES